MGRNTGGNTADVRKSALWGSGNRGGEHRSNALWGKGGRGGVTLVVALVLSLGAGSVSSHSATAIASPLPATFVEPGLLERAKQSPERMFKLIVQSNISAQSAEQSFESVENDDDRELKQDLNDAHRAEQKAYIASLKSKSRSERD